MVNRRTRAHARETYGGGSAVGKFTGSAPGGNGVPAVNSKISVPKQGAPSVVLMPST